MPLPGPQSSGAIGVAASNTQSIRDYDFRDPAKLTRWLKATLILAIVVNAIGIVVGLLHVGLLGKPGFREITGTIEDGLEPIMVLVQIMIYLVAFFMFMRWIHRANQNSWALGATGMEFSPGWCIAWYFIPIANLWKPFQAMREIWKISTSPGNWQSAPSTPLLGWWWFLYLIASVLAQVVPQRGEDSIRPSEIEAVTLGLVVSNAIDLVFCLVAIAVVGRIAANQIAQSQHKVVDVF